MCGSRSRPGPTSGTLTPLTVSSHATPHPFLVPSSSLSLYWSIEEGTGLQNADVSFTYPQAGVQGNEGNYELYRIHNGEIRIIDSTLFISTNTGTVFGTSDFGGDWAAGERPPKLQLNGPSNSIVNPEESLSFSASGGRPPYSFTLVENNSGALLEQVSAEVANYTAGQTFGVTDKLRLTDSLGTSIDAVTSVVSPFVVMNGNDSGAGSLRRAITNSNSAPGVQTISFNFPGAGPHTIAPLSNLPVIIDTIVIDATTQAGYGGSPVVELSGINIPSGGIGLKATSNGNFIKGLAVNRWSSTGIYLHQGGGSSLAGNYVGTDTTGTQAKPNQIGISSHLSPNNSIGDGTLAGRNVISGNFVGLIEWGSSIVIKGNYIGTNAGGTAAIPNTNGVHLTGPGAAIHHWGKRGRAKGT